MKNKMKRGFKIMYFKIYLNNDEIVTIAKEEYFDFNAANSVIGEAEESVTISIVNHIGETGENSLLPYFNQIKNVGVAKIEWYQGDKIIYSVENNEIHTQYSINANPSIQEYLNFSLKV